MTALQQLVRVEDGAVVADSRDVAEAFGRRHTHVLREIERLIDLRPDIGPTFGLKAAKVKTGFGERDSHYYTMNRKGFVVLVSGFKGDRALDFRIAFYDAFERMERTIAAMEAEAAALSAPERPAIMDDRDRLRDAIAFVRAAQIAKRCPVARRAWTVVGLPDVFTGDAAIETFGAAGDVDPVVTAWAEDRLEQADGQRTPTCILFEDHQHWCNAQGIRPAGARGFSQALTAMGVIGFKSSRMQRLNVRLRTMGAV
ncbi:Rha family transcriptional regulator [Sphingomonas sp. GM_Shp_2]|uniref:Rha family transcriptional regulator n=1 Tax=Sphingomonas sp. GM_Shp_2 TaxID=2937380 RepID=UPI002269BBC7|nr:Rha family transcriptional regulator [Sphingomonas sp. GM_Shp_2]